MKKILIISLAILLAVSLGSVAFAKDYGKAVIAGSGNQPTNGYKAGHGPGDIMGQGRYPSDPHRTFRFVRYVAPEICLEDVDMIVSRNSVVIWDSGASGDDGVTVTVTVTSQDTSIAGILATDALPPISTDTISAAAADVGKRNWAWLQTYGKATAFHAHTGPASVAKYAFGCSAVTGEIDTYYISGDAAGGTIQDTWMNDDANFSDNLGYGGFFYQANTTAHGEVKVFLKCE